jgi:hypothetical protein
MLLKRILWKKINKAGGECGLDSTASEQNKWHLALVNSKASGFMKRYAQHTQLFSNRFSNYFTVKQPVSLCLDSLIFFITGFLK